MENQYQETGITVVQYNDLSDQTKALHRLSIIKKFLSGGFEGEKMFSLDQEIIDHYDGLPSEDNKAEYLRTLEFSAFTF